MDWKKAVWLVLTFTVLAFFGHLYYQKFLLLSELRHQQQQLQAEVDALEAEITRLSKEIDLLENDPEKLEKLAREKLGLARRNEKIFIIESTPVPIEE